MQDLVYVALGLVGLFLGGDWLVRGASRIAQAFSISPLIIGLTIVAIGTSAPELVVSLIAATQGNSGIALGNVLGSNIANIGLILGLTGVISAVAVKETLVRREIPIMILTTFFATLLVLDGQLSRLDGILLLFGFLVFTLMFYYLARADSMDEDDEPRDTSIRIPVEIGFVLLGSVGLVLGANFLVEGATNIARALGVPDLIIGVTVVAIGTSLPELATSLTAAFKGESDIAVGNVVGSNISNLLLILGATSFVGPFTILPDLSAVGIEFIAMLGFSLMLWPFARNRVLSRFESALFLGAYLAFIIFSLSNNIGVQ